MKNKNNEELVQGACFGTGERGMERDIKEKRGGREAGRQEGREAGGLCAVWGKRGRLPVIAPRTAAGTCVTGQWRPHRPCRRLCDPLLEAHPHRRIVGRQRGIRGTGHRKATAGACTPTRRLVVGLGGAVACRQIPRCRGGREEAGKWSDRQNQHKG